MSRRRSAAVIRLREPDPLKQCRMCDFQLLQAVADIAGVAVVEQVVDRMGFDREVMAYFNPPAPAVPLGAGLLLIGGGRI